MVPLIILDGKTGISLPIGKVVQLRPNEWIKINTIKFIDTNRVLVNFNHIISNKVFNNNNKQLFLQKGTLNGRYSGGNFTVSLDTQPAKTGAKSRAEIFPTAQGDLTGTREVINYLVAVFR